MNEDAYILKEGGRSGFEDVFKRYSRFVFNSAYGVLLDSDLANDVVQDVFCTIWADKNKIKIERPLGGQLWLMARNRALDIKRHRAFDVLNEDFKNFDERQEVYIDIISDAELNTLVCKLPQRYRTVFLLKYQFGKSAAEISKTTGMALQTVRNNIHEGLMMLRKMLKHA